MSKEQIEKRAREISKLYNPCDGGVMHHCSCNDCDVDPFLDIATYIEGLIQETEKRVAREINQCLFGYPKDKDIRIQSAIDKCNQYLNKEA